MDHHRRNTMNEVTSTFAAWKEVNDRIVVLRQALEQRGAVRDQRLSEMQAECQALELEAERLLLDAQHALLKIKTPRSSQGDSTWG